MAVRFDNCKLFSSSAPRSSTSFHMVSCYFCQSPVLVALFIDLKVFLVYFITRNSETVLEVFLLSVERLISSTAPDDLNTSFVVFWVLRKGRTVLFFCISLLHKPIGIICTFYLLVVILLIKVSLLIYFEN